MRTSTLLSALALVALSASASHTVHACAAPQCEPATVTPASGASIPKNTPALPFSSDGIAPTISLGSSVAATTVITDPKAPGWKLLVPASPLSLGTYDVEYTESCPAPAKVITRGFSAAADVALPTTLGSLRGDSAVVGNTSVPNIGGSCTATIRALSFDLALTNSDTVASFLPVTRFEIRVDGALVQVTNYGEARKGTAGDVIAGSLVAACDVRDKDNLNGPTLGDHVVSVSSHVAGAATDPPSVEAHIRFNCEGGFANLPTDTDGGVRETGTGDSGTDTTTGSGDTSNLASDPNPDSVDGGNSGCAVSRSPKSPGVLGVIALGFAALARLRSRRRAFNGCRTVVRATGAIRPADLK